MLYYVLFMCMLLVMVIYMIFVFMSYYTVNNMETMSCYECGFDPNSFTRFVFSYRFFLISILFIIFDVEISLMLPVPFLLLSSVGLWIFYTFIIILIVGVLYEYICGSLDWLDILN